jgi:hypothetical protein
MPAVVKKNVRLTKAEQRVQISKDALKWIKKENVKVKESSGYFYISKGEEQLKIGTDLNKYLKKIKCDVCAKGALFLSHVDRFDNCKIQPSYPGSEDANTDFDDEDDIKQRLSKQFSELQLDMIECAFEKKVLTDSTQKLGQSYNPSKIAQECIKFGKQYKKPYDRLEAILKNIVKNKGTFIPI